MDAVIKKLLPTKPINNKVSGVKSKVCVYLHSSPNLLIWLF